MRHIRLSEFIKMSPKKPDKPLAGSEAGRKAREMGLEYLGFGRWGTNGVTTHISKNGKLVPKPKSESFNKKNKK